MKACADRMPLRGLALAGLALLVSACASRVPTAAPVPTGTSTPATATPAGADHGDPEQRFTAALQLMKDKKADEAQKAFEELAKDFPNFSGPHTNLGILYARAKQRDQALASFNRAVALNPKNATAFDWLGILYREGNAYPQAEQSYLRAIAADPNNASAHLNLAILYDSYLKRPRDALKEYREYQRIAGTDRTIVTGWIDELEPPASTATPAPAAGSKP